ncbi:hypothetical protein CCM_03370 [Cordyceps militaris CM01]|uniref:Uncharacterized protein n=1 Tax=Cordyceps militaris (strain CM01) TaxID=983644 RepID=G3JAD0_CORMM|nr:uncharacterized protein CCM_03370 [Cordyceps militaris CM01]EGX95098.1 hypothetical protein CCM_03370 [Cordyceps militaris CM01]
MDFTGPITLPKGILTNSSTVYDEVAAYSTLPADKVHQYWHVYTTTNKKLKDPTARRLENFWWHVWGSDRSKLSGRVLARIFHDISLGPTIVPLRGPANRWEGPDASPLTIELIVAHLQRNFLVEPENDTASATKQNGKCVGASAFSGIRPSQLPPILKKMGSSSINMTRNTARFVSPHESAEEDGVESDIPSSGSTLANGFDIARQEVVDTEANVRGSATFQRSQSPAAAHEPAFASPKSKTQPVRNPGNSQAQQIRNAGQSRGVKDTARQQSNTTTNIVDSFAQHDVKEAPKISARDKMVRGKQPVMRRTQSSTIPDRLREHSTAKPTHSLFTVATSSTTNVAAQGTIIDQAGSVASLPQLSTSNSAKYETSSHGGSSASSVLDARLTPTQPSSSAVLPLGRTKSQLTLLLEREKERSRS